MEGPPEDDCCPVCHGRFNLPCRTSCFHWFCGDCILRVWLYGDAMKQCRCPLCCRCFSRLTPLEASFDCNQDPGAMKIMENLRRYNRLHVGGLKGLTQKALELPFLARMTLQDMMDPDKTRANLFKARMFAILVGCIYVLIPLDFIPIAVNMDYWKALLNQKKTLSEYSLWISVLSSCCNCCL
ncbi:E3 ubiquitin-protein ligase [Quillaja saponaria]|uniref:E3 ubiquitin-protein ligase n=1 Tax=Quillaja saponaria TaxID=32244 RepID=A0AAD7M3K3_QUISA|nr:E3 ubiquitin-protein ligase [Quillaja saponaria]